MVKKQRTTDAVAILHRRYVKDNADRKASLATQRVNAKVSRMIYGLRKGAGLTQEALAELIGTTQSVISRLEDADYDGHSLSMLQRIAEALDQKVIVEMTAKDPAIGEVRYVFQLFIQMLRRSKKLTIEELARKTEIDRDELVTMERNPGYSPTPLTLHRLCGFYGIPERKMLVLVGAVRHVPEDVKEHASRFAARSESCAGLTREQRRALDEFMTFLKSET